MTTHQSVISPAAAVDTSPEWSGNMQDSFTSLFQLLFNKPVHSVHYIYGSLPGPGIIAEKGKVSR